MKTRRKMVFVIIICVVLFGIVGIFYVNFRQPTKYAVREKDFQKYPNAILVKEAWHTGTGWEKVGNASGFFKDTACYDVALVDAIPPSASIGGDHINTFLCLVEYSGRIYWDSFSGEFETYTVLEWYPVYPVLRNTILPSWLYPKGYMTEADIKNYSS